MASHHDVTRRQFLNYTLMGVGGFMAATITLPMVRFAIDPLLSPGQGTGKFYDTGLKASKLTDMPQQVKFTEKNIQDGWYKFDQKKEVFLFKEKDEIYALSPVCTHLGCLVHWSTKPPYSNRFLCPCHGSRYTKKGINVAGLPATAPLHRYETKVKNGNVYIGNLHNRDSIPPAPPKY
ncbi:MAG TPA: ubiquinol-cytochrome c reductase iron-sulfur subunit [Bacillales bacterium]|nr:ubiquinol-cytochrome c reductase iron-sulfur subunit [Bacillales bacterium]